MAWLSEVEVESTLVYVLPRDIAQGRLFDDFCAVVAELEVATYRVTRTGDVVWRLGARALVAVGAAWSRLRLVDALTNDGVRRDETHVSCLKCTVATHRVVRYRASDPAVNVRYPLLIEDSVSFEASLDTDTERLMARVDADTADNNLGLRHVNRVSWRTEAGNGRVVRVSMRAVLNEFHEIAYQLELECERPAGALETPTEREERHVALEEVFVRRTLPLLRAHWPDGLRSEGPRVAPAREALDDASRWLVRTGRSHGSRARLGRAVAARLRAGRSFAKLKFDGERAYAVAHHGALISESRALLLPSSSPSSLTDSLCGLYVYQVERGSDFDAVTEVAFVTDHRALVARGNSVLAHQVERSRYARSHEQQYPRTAYIVDAATGASLWPRLDDAFERVGLRFETERFVATSAHERASSGSLRLMPVVNSLANVARDRSWARVRAMAQRAPRHVRVTGLDDASDDSLAEILVPVDARFSAAAMCHLHDSWLDRGVSDAAGLRIRGVERDLRVARPFAGGGDAARLAATVVERSALVDGVLLHDPRLGATTYVKMKIRQTVELLLSWDARSLVAAEGRLFATRSNAGRRRETWVTSEDEKLRVRGLDIRDLLNRRRERFVASARVFEFAVQRPGHLIYVRPRDDKFAPDSWTKARTIVFGRLVRR